MRNPLIDNGKKEGRIGIGTVRNTDLSSNRPCSPSPACVYPGSVQSQLQGRPPMSIVALRWAWKQHSVKGLTKFVLVRLADRANDKGECWPGMQSVADECGISRRSVLRAIEQLENDGLLIVQRTHWTLKKPNSYRIVAAIPDVTGSHTNHHSETLDGLSATQSHQEGWIRKEEHEHILRIEKQAIAKLTEQDTKRRYGLTEN